jgi:hypothetical protein
MLHVIGVVRVTLRGHAPCDPPPGPADGKPHRIM